MLKNANYYDKRTGLTIPVVAKAEVNTETKSATFKIGVSREAIDGGRVLNVVKIQNINFDRTQKEKNLLEQAYEVAKGQREEIVWDTVTESSKKTLVNQPFYGWEDEIGE